MTKGIIQAMDNPLRHTYTAMFYEPERRVLRIGGIDSSASMMRRRIEETVVGRGDRIRTCDILLPKQARYQAALRPDAAGSRSY